MSKWLRNVQKLRIFSDPVYRALTFGLSLFLGMLGLSVLFVPLSRGPNWNVILLSILTVLSLLFVSKTVRSATDGKKIFWGAFAGLVLWLLLGQLLPHEKIAPTSAFAGPFSEVDISSFAAAPYLLCLIVMLIVGYYAKAVARGPAMIGMVFSSTWAAEMYFRSYTENVPEAMMPTVANLLAALFVAIFAGAAYGISKSRTPERKLFFGYWLYFGAVYAIGALTVFPTPMPEFW